MDNKLSGQYKVTSELVVSKIKTIEFNKIGDRLTHCTITLENGFLVTGESSCVDPAEYCQETGERIAKDRAVDKIWMLEAYLLREAYHNAQDQ